MSDLKRRKALERVVLSIGPISQDLGTTEPMRVDVPPEPDHYRGLSREQLQAEIDAKAPGHESPGVWDQLMSMLSPESPAQAAPAPKPGHAKPPMSDEQIEMLAEEGGGDVKEMKALRDARRKK